MTTDDILSEATEIAARVALGSDPAPKEQKHVAPATLRALQSLTRGTARRNVGIRVRGWLPSPGATDIAIGKEAPYEAVIEVKVDDIGWCLWDLLKVASLIDSGKASSGYLVVGATVKKFARRPSFAEVLRDRTEITTADLFQDYPRDWLDLLQGGSGRPKDVPATLGTQLLTSISFDHAPGWELRLIKVTVPDDARRLKFDTESWPAGHPRLSGAIKP